MPQPDRDSYIERNPEVKGGVPVIRGTRLTVSAVKARIAGGDSLEEVIADYDYIDPGAIRAAAQYKESLSAAEFSKGSG